MQIDSKVVDPRSRTGLVRHRSRIVVVNRALQWRTSLCVLSTVVSRGNLLV